MDVNTRRTTLRLLSNGVYVVTARHGERYGAATVTWISQASFKPPLVMAAIRPGSNVFECLSRSGFAAIHIVASNQLELAQKFFFPTKAESGLLNGEPFCDGVTQSPILRNLHAHVECRVVQILPGVGDHAVVLLEVVEAECNNLAHPLTIAESPWQYGG